MARKNSTLVVHERISAIVKQIADGVYSTPDLIRFITNNYNVGKDQAHKDLRKARDYIKDNFNGERNEMIAELQMKLQHLYSLNFDKEDYKESRACLTDLARLLGLNAPDKKEISGSLKIGHTPDDVEYLE